MSQQIKVFNKNKLDLTYTNASISVTDATATYDGSDIVNYLRNRNNYSAWATTNSNDAANTTLVCNFGDVVSLTDIILVKHNLKSYTIKYWDGSAYQDFSTAISETINTETTTFHSFDQVNTERIQIIITGTMTANDDKILRQLIATSKVLTGQLQGWPEIKKPTHTTGKRINTMLSGKINVVETLSSFSMQLSVKNWNIDADLSIVEQFYFGRRGFLISISGGDEDQFSHKRIGYRKEDIYLMRAVDDYEPEWNSFVYKNGIKLSISLRESIN